MLTISLLSNRIFDSANHQVFYSICNVQKQFQNTTVTKGGKKVTPKKHLGQHFLNDEHIAAKIASALAEKNTCKQVLEIGPGMGVLTKYLLDQQEFVTHAIDIDKESVIWLKEHFPALSPNLIEGDFLQLHLPDLFKEEFSLIGNFPYNISSQIVFKILDNKPLVPLMVGMFQKEVAERFCASPRNKAYGILSVLTQAYYHTEYLFTVNEDVFTPPPKVKSAVIRITRKAEEPDIEQKLLFRTVKTAFNQRRKKLRNALQQFQVNDTILQEAGFIDKRAEELSVSDFITLSKIIKQHGKNHD